MSSRQRRRRNPFAEGVDGENDEGEEERGGASIGRPGNPFHSTSEGTEGAEGPEGGGREARRRRNPFASESGEGEEGGSLKAAMPSSGEHADEGGDGDAAQQQHTTTDDSERGEEKQHQQGLRQDRKGSGKLGHSGKSDAVITAPVGVAQGAKRESTAENLLFEGDAHESEESINTQRSQPEKQEESTVNLSVLMPSAAEDEKGQVDAGDQRRHHDDLFSSPSMSPAALDEAPSSAILDPARVRRAAARPNFDAHDVSELRTMVDALLRENQELKALVRRQDNEPAAPIPQGPVVRRVSPRDAFLTISRGQDCSLEPYRPIEEKMRLADLAERVGGGVATTRVALFLATTLKRSVFTQILSARPRLCRHYINCLRRKGEWRTAHDIARAAGLDHIADDVLLRHVYASSSSSQTLERMASALRELSHHGRKETAALLRQDKVLLSMQLAMEEQDTSSGAVASSTTLQGRPAHARLPLTSATTTVFYSALYHYKDKHDAAGSYTSVVDTLKMHEKLLQASAMRALIQRRDWSQLQQLFTTKSLFRSAKLAPRISPAHIVEALTRAQAPQEEIARYLPLVKDVGLRFRLAKKAQAHDAAIDALVEMKDVEALRSYSLCQGVTASRALSNRVASLLRDTKRWAK